MIKARKYQRICPALGKIVTVELAYFTSDPKTASICVTKPISYMCSGRAIAEYLECESCAPHIPDKKEGEP